MDKQWSKNSTRSTRRILLSNVFGLVMIFALLNWSCSSIFQPVTLKGEQSDLALLTGEWDGEYYSKELGRGGSIQFKLAAGEDSAYGEVIMIPRGSQIPLKPPTQTGKPRTEVQPLEVLKINFVQISGGRVSGKIDPYWDPDNKCVLLAFFDGVLKGDTIKGTFRTRRENSGYFYTGNWEVRRKNK